MFLPQHFFLARRLAFAVDGGEIFRSARARNSKPFGISYRHFNYFSPFHLNWYLFQYVSNAIAERQKNWSFQ